MGIKNFGFESIETYLQKGVYFIPDYQREYSWIVEEQLEDLWMDLENCVEEKRSSHFFGQVVIHDDKDEEKKYIIDGQQRTSTSIIFLAVLRDLFYKLYKDFNISDAQNRYEDIRIKFIGRYSEEENELRLTLGRIDRDYFRENIQIKDPGVDEPKEDSHRRIKEAYEFFKSKLWSKIFDLHDDSGKYKTLKVYYDCFLKNFKLMYVETDELDEAFIIFETLNARGKDLEISDLLKNHLFRTSNKSIDKIKENWNKTVENLENIDVTKFLRHYWNSRYHFSREKDLYKRIRIKIDTPKKCEEFTDDFYKLSDVYKALNNPNEVIYFNEETQINKYIKNLKIINASSFYPVILAMVNTGFEETNIEKVLKVIETLFVRNCVVAGKVANRYEILFAKIAYDISQKLITDVTEICSKIRNEIISDEDFENFFMSLSVKSVAIAKFILREINNFKEKEIEVISSGQKIHLEHIMPKTKGEFWNHIDDESHKKNLNKIGNLTLLGEEYNKSIKNRDFSTKKEIYKKSKILITKDIVNYDSWNEETIKDRQKKLFEEARKRWSLDG